MRFADHFSGHAGDYARYRPRYPKSLFNYLNSLVSGHQLAWDCATGNGQVALDLTAYFDCVIASDASYPQVSKAAIHPKIHYSVANAEWPPFAPSSIDLITIGQALHWFATDHFMSQAKQILRPGGVIAAWSYGLAKISPSIDAIIEKLYEEILGPYWPEERRLVEQGYAGIPFPFATIEAPEFAMTAEWNLAQWVGYLETWSALQRYMKARNSNPIDLIFADLIAAWGDKQATRTIIWPLSFKLGKKA